jgi:cytochrome c-type biogenesis protein CcmH
MTSPFLPDSLLFWFIALVMTGLALAFVLPRLLARRPPRARAHRMALNAAVVRGELDELDRARGDGLVTQAQHAQARIEIERRFLADAADASAPLASWTPPRSAAAVVGVALPALAFGLYMLFGNPAALDAQWVSMDRVNAEPGAVPVEREALARHLARYPQDGRGWVLLARMDFASNRFEDAAAAYGKAIAASPKVAKDALIWCEYADALGMAQGGTLAGRPRELVLHALALDGAHPKALDMAGSEAYEQRDYVTALRHWRQLLGQLAEGSPEHRELAAAIARVEQVDVAAVRPAGIRP